MSTESLTDILTEAEPSWLDRHEYPFVPRYFGVDHHWMHYVEEGRHGEPIVFVHGTPTWSFLWRRLILLMRDSNRCVASDHLGFGLSDKPTQPSLLTPERHAERLESLLLSLDLPKFTMVVHDFGGPIGLSVAMKHPELVKRLVVINSWLWPIGEEPGARRMSRMLGGGVGRYLYVSLNLSAKRMLPRVFADRENLSRALHDQYVGPFLDKKARLGPWVLARSLNSSQAFFQSLWDQREVLKQFPMLLLWGAKDPLFGKSLGTWERAFPDAEVVLCQRSGHFPQEEQPDLVISEISKFVREGLH
ncbi:MAG: alpha/beta fold hydrolase [Myxococcaceae bacterium]